MSRLGDRIVKDGPYDGITPPLAVRSYAMQSEELNDLRNELIELQDLRILQQMQWDRMAEATALWRAEDPEARALTMPDLGALLQWLMDRAVASVPAEPCREETPSWRHFTPEQMDSYWIRCTLQGPHDEHKDEHTGLTWTAISPKPGGGR